MGSNSNIGTHVSMLCTNMEQSALQRRYAHLGQMLPAYTEFLPAQSPGHLAYCSPYATRLMLAQACLYSLGVSAHMALQVRQDVERGRRRRVAEAAQRVARGHRCAARQAQLRHDLVDDLDARD